MRADDVCSLCQEDGVVRVNGSWFCIDHVDDGFRFTLRGVAALRGADPDLIEEAGVEMLEELRRRDVVGLAQLPHLTEAELEVLHAAVDARRVGGAQGEERRVLWSLSTACAEAIQAARLDAQRRRRELDP